MHTNLERRFVRLSVACSSRDLAILAFQSRYHLLFAALCEDLGVTAEALAKRVGFDPFPEGGNKITNGEADASPEDCAKLLAVYEDMLIERLKA